jgi:hypothetical protein
MSDFDHAAAFAAQADPAVVIGRLLAATGKRFGYRDWYTNRAIPLPGGPKRTADLVAILNDLDAPARPALLIFEFQSSHDPTKLNTTLVEAAVFRAYAHHGEDDKGEYRVFCGLVYLKGTCPDAVLDMTLAGGYGTRHAPLLWEVEKDDAGEALEAVATGRASWGLLFWIALMTGADREGIIARWRELVSDPQVVASPEMRQALVVVALELAELAGRFLVWEHALEGMGMGTGESIVGNRLRAQGSILTTRALLVRLLQTKYPSEFSTEVKQLVEQQNDLSLLNQWFETALEKQTFEEYDKTLN